MKEKLKDYFTDIFGAGVMIATIILIYTSRASWLWEGVTGVIVGAVFLLVPDGWIVSALKKFINKKNDE